jgi:hypothetical protein
LQFQGVTIRFEDGSHQEGSVLVAADGINSKIRSLLFPAPTASRSSSSSSAEPSLHSTEYTGYSYYRAIFNDEIKSVAFSCLCFSVSLILCLVVLLRAKEPAWESWGDGKRFGLVPLKGSELFWFGVRYTNPSATPVAPVSVCISVRFPSAS